MVLSSFCEQPVSLTENGHARGRRNSVISRNFSCPGKRRKNKSLIVEKFRMATPYSMDTSERAITRKGSGRTSQVTGARPNMTARVSCVSDPSRRCWRLEIPQTKTYSDVVAVFLIDVAGAATAVVMVVPTAVVVAVSVVIIAFVNWCGQ